MARIVLCCWGSYGDLYPYLGLGLELKRRGHSVVIATCPAYGDAVHGQGLAFAPMRPDVDPADSALIARVMDPARGTEVIARELLVPALRDAYVDLSAAMPGADFVVSHPITFAAPIVAEQLGIPWLSTILAPASFFSVHDFPILPPHTGLARLARVAPWAARAVRGLAKTITQSWTAPVGVLRQEIGLPDRGNALFEGQFSPRGTLALYSPVLGGPQPDWPPHAQTTGFVFYDDPTPMPAALDAFLAAGELPIVFTLGSSAVGAPGRFYEESWGAALAIGRRAVLLVGRDLDAWAARTLPPGVIAADYAPHAALFPRAAATVHHGGAGTTGQALRAGRPMLVVPHAHDQPDNAARVVRLGVARAIDASRYTAARAARHLRALLDTPAAADRAASVGAIVRAERGAIRAAEAIEAALAAR